MNDMAEIYSHTTTFYSVSSDNTGLILAVIGLFIVFIGLFLSSCSCGCGGRDGCGKKWCIIGIFDDYAFFIMSAGLGILAAGLLWKWFYG